MPKSILSPPRGERRAPATARRGFVAAAVGVALSSWLVACGAVQRPDGGTGLLPVGSSAPDVVGTNAAGERVRLSGQLGHPAVVYFYPMDETPGCTREACAFRDAFDRYTERHVTIFGVSQDSEQSHGEFRAKQRLPFPLVADEDGSVTRAYGVPSRLGMSSRVTFLVDGSGHVARVWPDVDPGVHASEVLAAAAELACGVGQRATDASCASAPRRGAP
jgi:peroxiredoxin Q/BCP